jgi:hypothetical protein
MNPDGKAIERWEVLKEIAHPNAATKCCACASLGVLMLIVAAVVIGRWRTRGRLGPSRPARDTGETPNQDRLTSELE